MLILTIWIHCAESGDSEATDLTSLKNKTFNDESTPLTTDSDVGSEPALFTDKMVSGNIVPSKAKYWYFFLFKFLLYLNVMIPYVPFSVRPEWVLLTSLWRKCTVPAECWQPNLSMSGGFYRWWTVVCGWVFLFLYYKCVLGWSNIQSLRD